MSSEAQNRANAKNARRSSGPKSSDGKRRSSQNSRKHGLSKPIEIGHEDHSFNSVVEILQEDGFSELDAIEVAVALYTHRRVMDVYRDYYLDGRSPDFPAPWMPPFEHDPDKRFNSDYLKHMEKTTPFDDLKLSFKFAGMVAKICENKTARAVSNVKGLSRYHRRASAQLSKAVCRAAD